MDSAANTLTLLDAAEVARRLNVSRPYIYKLVRERLLTSVSWTVPGKVKGRQVVRFHPDDVEDFIARNRGSGLSRGIGAAMNKNQVYGPVK
jgi:excisionase family DNA binding protein